MTKKELIEKIENSKANSAWKRGVKTYALLMVEDFDKMPTNVKALKEMCLNGAEDFTQASYDGGFYIYDADICETLCSPSEIKRTRHGELQPNSRETWLDVQARALIRAFSLIRRLIDW